MTTSGRWEKIEFTSRGDERGELVAIEGLKGIPFEIRRVYYLIETKVDVRRGFHAHRELDQILIAIAGQCRVKVDDGSRTEEFLLNDCKVGLRIQNLIWREMFDFSPDCVLLVLASDYYNEADYIRNYDSFLLAVNKMKSEDE